MSVITRIRIVVAHGQSPADHVSLQFSNHISGKTAVLMVPLPSSFVTKEIRWYLEDYPQSNPFDRERARDAEDALLEHARDLAFWIHASEVLDLETAKVGALVVDIEDSPDMPSSILWEALEHKSGIPSLAAFDFVGVSHIFPDRDDTASDGKRKVARRNSWETGTIPKLNVLIVTSRRSFDSDIPHRLAAATVFKSLDAVNELERIIREEEAAESPDYSVSEAGIFSKSLNIHVLVPATFDSFQSRLEGEEPGYFDLVHLDLHGIEDRGRVKLSFMKLDASLGSLTCLPDDRPVEQVAELLQKHQVRRVVLNACRSAKRFGSGESIPRILRAHGVDEVLAMSFQISSLGVQQFILIFYFVFFCARCVQVATWYARRSLIDNPERRSRIGDEIPIMDYIVPQYFRSEICLRDDDETFKVPLEYPRSLKNDEKEDHLHRNIFGRDHELLEISCRLLEGDKPVFIVGEPGIGKTFMLSNLVDWWIKIRYVKGAHIVQLSQDKSFTVDKMCRYLHEVFHCPDTYAGPDSLITFLKSNRYFVVIDSVEAMTVDAVSSVDEQKKQLRKFVRMLQGGESLLVLSSRRDDPFLARYTRPFHLRGLGMLSSLQYMRSVLKLRRLLAPQILDEGSFANQKFHAMASSFGVEEGNPLFDRLLQEASRHMKVEMHPTWEKEEDSVYLEEICKMVDGHPLALCLVTDHLISLGPNITPKEFVFSSLRGGKMMNSLPGANNLEKLGIDDEGYRSWKEAEKVIAEYAARRPGPSGILLAALRVFWRVFPRGYLSMFNRLRNKGLKTESIPLEQLLLRARNGDLDQMIGGPFPDRDAIVNSLEALVPKSAAPSADREDATAFEETVLEVHESFEVDFVLEEMLKVVIETMKKQGADSEVSDEVKQILEQILEQLSSSKDPAALILQPTKAEVAKVWEGLLEVESSVVDEGLDRLAEFQLVQRLAPEELPDAAAKMEYFKISPIVSLLLRNDEFWNENERHLESCRIALAVFYARRCAADNWPAPGTYETSEAGGMARMVSDLEFYNLSSATAVYQFCLERVPNSPILGHYLLTVIKNLEWAMLSDATRLPMLFMLWESCLESFETQLKGLESSPDRPTRKRSFSAFLSGKAINEEEVSEKQRQVELQLLHGRIACIGFAMSLLKCYHFVDDSRRQRCGEVIKYASQGIRSDTAPLEILQEPIKLITPLRVFSEKYAESLVSYFPFNLRKTKDHLRQIWEAEVIPSMLAVVGHRIPTTAEPDTLEEKIKKISQMLRGGRYDDGIALVDSLFYEETSQGQNDPGLRSTLLFLRATMLLGNEKFPDALSALEKCCELNDLANGTGTRRFSPFQMFLGMVRRFLVWSIRVQEARTRRAIGSRLVPCSSCGMAKAKRPCSGCSYSSYCSTACQKRHWEEHSKVCKSIFSGW